MRNRPPSPTVAALVGAQYYWIEHVHPVGLLGYVLLLEGWPPTPETVEELRRRTGTRRPPSARCSRTPTSTRTTARSSTPSSTRCH